VRRRPAKRFEPGGTLQLAVGACKQICSSAHTPGLGDGSPACWTRLWCPERPLWGPARAAPRRRLLLAAAPRSAPCAPRPAPHASCAPLRAPRPTPRSLRPAPRPAPRSAPPAAAACSDVRGPRVLRRRFALPASRASAVRQPRAESGRAGAAKPARRAAAACGGAAAGGDRQRDGGGERQRARRAAGAAARTLTPARRPAATPPPERSRRAGSALPAPSAGAAWSAAGGR
jgi:hypothetical protein